MRASTGDGYSPGYAAFTSSALLALRWSVVSEQFVLLAKSPASRPSSFACLPSSRTLCPTLFTLWVLPGSQLGGVAPGPVRPSVKEKGRRSSGFDMLPEEGHAQMCFEIFVLLACLILLSCCILVVVVGVFCRLALISPLWRDHFISSLDSYILFVLLADPINTHFYVIFKL